ncbi:centrosome-associated protein CEP250 [Prorops nasuta]|uniref:centrosome-associated protein CEP250 n=1 Tax=Prorops nasuta TaxID=863751 RepID=UPI0034CD605E
MPRALPKSSSPLTPRGQMERRRPPFLRGSTMPAKTKEPEKLTTSKMELNRNNGGGDRSTEDDLSPDALVRQNFELRHRLEQETASYKRRLETYKQAQQHQATLVSRLQAKVLQYKSRCSELENQMVEAISCENTKIPLCSTVSACALSTAHQTLRDYREDQILDLDTALKKLGEERRRCEKLMQLNTSLKEQLEESHQTNEALTNDLQKLSNDWDFLREELAIKEEEWKEEEQTFKEYYTSEHNKLLNLWRDVVSVKRLFAEMKTTTNRDLIKLQNSIAGASKDIATACNTTNFALRLQASATQPLVSQQVQQVQAISELKTEMANLNQQYELAQNEIRSKDDRINQLIRDIHALEERCGEAETEMNNSLRMQEEIEHLQSALREIAHAVIQDAETTDIEISHASHVHLTPSGSIPQRSPKRSARSNTIPAFAESTISAVQAVLHKYQLTIHELQVKLQTNKEQLILVRKQCDNAEENAHNLENKIDDLINQLDITKSQCTQLTQEKEVIQKNLDNIRVEKSLSEKNRMEINNVMETIKMDYEKLQKSHYKLQKLYESSEDETVYLKNELDRLSKELELRELNIRSEEDKHSKIREENLTLREELNKTYLDKDMLEQQKLETDQLITQIEKTKSDLELEIERILLEKSDLQEFLTKLETVCANHEQDKQRLQEELKKVIEEKNKYFNQCSDQQSDLGSLRKELLQAEQMRLDLESEKVTLIERSKFLEIEKEKIELELGQATRERSDLSNQLSVLARKKETLNDELMRLRQRLEQANETNARINRSLEDLVKDNEEKQVILETNEKELQRFQEQLASMRSEKETLEGVLFDTQTNLESTHNKKTQLENEQKESLIKHENLKGHIDRLMKELENCERRSQEMQQNLLQQNGDQEAEFQQIITNLKKQSEDNIKKLIEEKEQIKVALEKRLQQSLSQMDAEKNAEINQLQQRLEELQQHIEKVCQQHEEVLLRAANDKQQALLIAHHDQQALIEKLETALRELEEERGMLERTKREAVIKTDQDRNNTNQLRDEINSLKMKLNEIKLKGEEDKLRLELKIEELWKERDSAQKDCEELQVQLHMTEDKMESLQNQLQDTIRKLKDVENINDSLRKELIDVRRQLTSVSYEKEKYCTSNKELREHVKRIESEKREKSRTLEEVYQKVAALEDAKLTIDAERTRLQTQIRDMERDSMQTQQQLRFVQDELQKAHDTNSQAQNNEKELQARLANETEEKERLQHQLHGLKKQMADLDNSLEVTRQELQRLRLRADEEDERWRGREQELVERLDDSRCRERKLEDQKHNLEVCLADASQQLQELKARLGGSDGRVRALDTQLSQLEAAKREVEQKLSSIGATLRRIAGIQMDGSVSIPFKLMSPSRRWSPARVQDHGDTNRDLMLDVDPEAVRKGVRSLMQQVAQIERERDDYETELFGLKKQLVESQDNQNKLDLKLNTLLNNFRALQDDKNIIEGKLSQRQAAFQAQAEALLQKTQEIEQLREKLISLELIVSGDEEERNQYEDKLDKLRQALNKSESDKRILQEELNRCEARGTKLELQRMSLEGDLQRLQMMLQEKESNVQKLHDRAEAHNRTASNLEERCTSLKSTIEQLNASLEKASITESELKSELNMLQRNLMEITIEAHSNDEKLKQLQKQHTNSDNERRVLSERLESVQQALTDMRHMNQTLADQNARLQNELANNEVQRSGLEAQLRLTNWPQDGSLSKDDDLFKQLHSVERERNDYKGRFEALNDKLKLLETEKRNLERQLSSLKSSNIRSKGYESCEKHVEFMGSNLTIDVLEQENRELKLKIRRLETQLAEKETELIKTKSLHVHSSLLIDSSRDRIGEIERLRAAQLQAEKLLEAREQSHRQQVLRLENQVQEKEDNIRALQKRIENLETQIISSHNGLEKDNFKKKSNRRRTWGGSNLTSVRYSMFDHNSLLKTIKEVSPERIRSNLTEIQNQSFQTELEDFEVALLECEAQRLNAISDESIIAPSVTVRRVQFMDDMNIKSCDSSYTAISEKKDGEAQTLPSPSTPKGELRHRYQQIEQQYNELREYSVLEKQILNETSCNHEEELKSLAELNIRIKKMSAEIKEKDKLCKNLTKINSELQTDIRNFMSERDEYERISKQCRQDVTKVRTELQTELINATLKNEKYEEMLRELRQELIKNNEDIEINNTQQMTVKIKDLERYISELESLNQSLTENLQMKSEVLSNVNNTDKIHKESARAITELKSIIPIIEDNNPELKTTITTLEENNKELKSEKAFIAEHNAELKPVIVTMEDVELRTKIATLENNNIDLKTTIASLEENVTEFKTVIAALEKNNGELRTTIAILEENNPQMKTTIHTLEENNAELKTIIATLEANSVELKTTIAALEKNNIDLKKDLDMEIMKSEEVRTDVKGFAEDIKMLEKQISLMTIENNDLVNLLEEKTNAFEKAENNYKLRIQDLEAQLSQKITEKSKLNDSVKVENKSTNYKIDESADNNLHHKDKSKDEDLQKICNELEHDYIVCSNDLMEKVEEIDKMRATIEEVSLENQRLQAELTEIKKIYNTKKNQTSEESKDAKEIINKSFNGTLHLSTLYNDEICKQTILLGLNSDGSLDELQNQNETKNCTNCKHYEDLNDSRRLIKVDVKEVSRKVEDSEKKLKKTYEKTQLLKLKASEGFETTIENVCNLSISNVNNSTIDETNLQQQLDVLKINTDQLMNKCDDKQNELETLKNESFSDPTISMSSTPMKVKLSKREERITKLENGIHQLNNDLHSNFKQVSEMQLKVQNYLSENIPNFVEINSLKVTNESLNKKLLEAEETIKKYHELTSDLEQVIQSSQELCEYDNLIGGRKSLITDLKLIIFELHKEIVSLKNHLMEKTNFAKLNIHEISSLNKEDKSNKVSECTIISDVTNANGISLSTEIQNSVSEPDKSYRHEEMNHVEIVSRLNEEITQLKQNLETVNKLNTDLVNNRNITDNRYKEELNATVTKYEERLKEIQEKANQLSKELSTYASENSYLKSELTKLQKSAVNNEETTSLKQNLEALEKEKNELMNNRKAREIYIAELNEQLNIYSSENNNLNEEIIKLKNNISKDSNKEEAIKLLYQKNVQYLQDQLNQSNDSLSKSIEEINCLKIQISKMQELSNQNNKEDREKIISIDKLNEDLEAVKECFIKEIILLQSKKNKDELQNKSIQDLLKVFLQEIMVKQQELAKVWEKKREDYKLLINDVKRQSADEVKKANQWSKELENEIERLQGLLTQQEKNFSNIQEKLLQSEHTLREALNEKASLLEKSEELEKECNNLQSKFDKQSKVDIRGIEAISAVQKLDIQKKEIEFQSKLNSMKEDHDRTVEQLTSTVQVYKTKIMDLTNTVEGLEANEKQLKSIIEMKTKELTHTNQNLQKIQTDMQQLTTIHDELNKEIECKNSHIADITLHLKNKCDLLSEYKDKLRVIMPDYENLKEQDAERIKILEKYKMEIESLKTDNINRLQVLEEEKNLLKISNAEQTKQIAEMTNKHLALMSDLEALSEQIDNLKKENGKLERKIRNSMSKKQAEIEIETLREINQMLKINLEGASNCNAELRESKNQLLKEITDLKGKFEMVQQNNCQLNKTLASYKSKLKNPDFEEKYEDLIQEKNQIALELEANKILLDQTNKEVQKHISENQSLLIKNKDLDEEAEELAKTIETLNKENAMLEDKSLSLLNNNERLQSELREAVNELSAKVKSYETLKVEYLGLKNSKLKVSEEKQLKEDYIGHNNSRCNSPVHEIRRRSRNELFNINRQVEVPDNDDTQLNELTELKKKLKAIEWEVVTKNSKIITLELQIQRQDHPIKRKCKDLQENLEAFQKKNSELQAQLMNFQCGNGAFVECAKCQNRRKNKKDQSTQSMPETIRLRPCSVNSSALVEDQHRIEKVEKEKRMLKEVCLQRKLRIRELEEKLTQMQSIKSQDTIGCNREKLIVCPTVDKNNQEAIKENMPVLGNLTPIRSKLKIWNHY